MAYPPEQIAGLRKYCNRLSSFEEVAKTFFRLDGLRLPLGCAPPICDGLLCPAQHAGYPSRLFFSEKITSPYTKNWNATNERIGESNWFAFSWKVDLPNGTLEQLLIAHLNGLASSK